MLTRGHAKVVRWGVAALPFAFALAARAQPLLEDLPVIVIEETPEPSDYFVRGDSNGDHSLELADAIHSLGYLFTGGPAPGCLKTADTNDDGLLDITDPITLLQFLFVGGPSPQSPFADCGVDLAQDGLGCAVYDFCPIESLGLHHFVVIDKGFSCVPDTPCNQFVARSLDPSGPGDVPITDVNVYYLLRNFLGTPPTEEQETQTLAAVFSGNFQMSGFLQAGPVTPTGVGTTLVGFATSIFQAFPDLTVPSFTHGKPVPSTPRGSFDLEVRIDVLNQGARPAAAFRVVVMQLGPRREDVRTALSYTVPSLKIDETHTMVGTIHFPELLVDAFVLRAVADADGEIRETNEENNSSQITVP